MGLVKPHLPGSAKPLERACRGLVCLPRARPRSARWRAAGAGPRVSLRPHDTVEGVPGALRVPHEPDLPLHSGECARATCLPASPLHGALTVQLVLVSSALGFEPAARECSPGRAASTSASFILLRDIQARHPGRQTQTWPRVGP